MDLRIEAARLEELRLGATEDRIEADLAPARHEDVVDEALAAYQAARQRLVEELGLERGPALQRLECAILKQDA
jgi:hypothetical protein